MSKIPTLYRIETYWGWNDSWNVVPFWDDMNKSKADGAFMVLKSFYGTGQKYRLVKYVGYFDRKNPQVGEMVDHWDTPKIHVI